MKSEDILQIIDLAIKVNNTYSVNINLHDLPTDIVAEVKKKCQESPYFLKDDTKNGVITIGDKKEHLKFCAPVTIFK